MSVVLFIDANQYLTLYGLIAGQRKLLSALEEQKAHVFVSAQIVDEVLRNKLRHAQFFFSDKLKELGAIEPAIPDHLLDVSDEKTIELRRSFDQAKRASIELKELARAALSRISRSDDEVSKRLAVQFDQAKQPNVVELQRARERRERGNPPGKSKDPLGDQITWEQLLVYCKEISCKRIWIITSDQDFWIKWEKQFLLNSLLHRDLAAACGLTLEVHCFADMAEGISHFGKNADVKADQLPTDEETAEIKKEIENLPPLDWLMGGTDDATMAVIRNYQARQHAFVAAMTGGSDPLGPLVSRATKLAE